ncbi:hypothetical protein E8E11_005754 [Didymella keratinophila]|nr:hypothetical protein E8E11_005754 [Didymella keratinophila]
MSKVLLVGATGYVGGTAELLSSVYGDRINIVYRTGLDDAQSIAAIAFRYDIAINAGSGFVTAGAKAFVNGLASRVKAGLPAPWLLHLSECTNLVDPSQQPFEWNDERDGQAILEHLKSLDVEEPTPSGLRKTQYWRPQQSKACKQSACRHRASSVRAPVFSTDKDWSFLWSLDTSFSTKGILFPTVGRALMIDIDQQAVVVAFDAGLLPREDTPQQREVRLAPLQEIADELTAGFCGVAKRGWGGEKAVRGTIDQNLLGWILKRQQEAWNQDFYDELVALKEGRRGITIASCIGASVEEP